MRVGIIAAFAACVLSWVTGAVVIPIFDRRDVRKRIYELGPASHKAKQGILTMGGLIFAVPMLVIPVAAGVLARSWNQQLTLALVSTIGFGLIGFVDDYIQIKKRRSLGLTPMQKIILQIFLASALVAWSYFLEGGHGYMRMPFANTTYDVGWLYFPVMVLFIIFFTNSINLLDGADGLLAGCASINFASIAILVSALVPIAALRGSGEGSLIVFACSAAGALIGYLRYNSHPARIIMGDAGSFTIAGALTALCLSEGLVLIMPVICLMTFVTGASVILQRVYFRLSGGRRMFRMSPLHHHFEMGGMSEPQIVTMYVSITAFSCAAALLWIA